MRDTGKKSSIYDLPRHLPSGSGLLKRIAEGKADPITDSQRAGAARIRIANDKKRGVKSPQWLVDLAKNA
ncbi:hypothetical protein GCM10009715_32440 [Paeniglutamicibacter psychrophenolicus]|uniref:Uncharacterized protein n=1 Tax=Paeniglutamicibacter psychrophenolicus TaxID=257454 RepID=A0ABS4W9E3_9MICC|nr:hypothetical protein [Paeniglutamicibacter psychrophenolicus]MBP2372831.1 hypothetical protein [Paeniglutamicibacter psychrophenolicus]